MQRKVECWAWVREAEARHLKADETICGGEKREDGIVVLEDVRPVAGKNNAGGRSATVADADSSSGRAEKADVGMGYGT